MPGVTRYGSLRKGSRLLLGYSKEAGGDKNKAKRVSTTKSDKGSRMAKSTTVLGGESSEKADGAYVESRTVGSREESWEREAAKHGIVIGPICWPTGWTGN